MLSKEQARIRNVEVKTFGFLLRSSGKKSVTDLLSYLDDNFDKLDESTKSIVETYKLQKTQFIKYLKKM